MAEKEKQNQTEDQQKDREAVAPVAGADPKESAKEADKAESEREKAEKAVAKAQEKADKTRQAAADAERELAEAQRVHQDAKDRELDAQRKAYASNEPKFTDDGREIGIDGENPVSNTNPSPRAV